MAIIDPLRDIDEYSKIAAESNAKIRWVILTHYHADFVSGFFDLAEQTKATIVFGPDANPTFDCKVASHGEVIPLGNHSLRVLHTPGHTFESSCFVLEDQSGKQMAVFSGDTLFLGDVGRPDLAQKGEITEKDLAKMLFQSLKSLKSLPDDCLILPAHGAGSACGKNISAGDFCTIGIQKKNNQAFKEEHEDAFVALVTTSIPPAPHYFALDVKLNKAGKVVSIDHRFPRCTTLLTTRRNP
jgi:glyoxylase-like metal-dependent hydrolase (beta-lactamase superfamily II)